MMTRNVLEWLEETAARAGSARAFDDGKSALSWGEVEHESALL